MLAGIAGLLAQRVRHRSAAAHELALPACWRGNPVDDFLFGRLALKRDMYFPQKNGHGNLVNC